MFILALPLQQNFSVGNAQGQQGCVHCRIISAIVPITPRVFLVFDYDTFRIHIERLGDCGANHMGPLAVTRNMKFYG